MAGKRRNNTRLNWLMNDAISLGKERRKKKDKQQTFLNQLEERELKLREKAEYNKQKNIRSKQLDKTLSQFYRQNDAFEVAKGRQDPNYFNMKYGGGAPSSVGGGASKTSKMAGLDDKTMFNAYEDRIANNHDWGDFGGKQPSFADYRDRMSPAQKTGAPIDPLKADRDRIEDFNITNREKFNANFVSSVGPGGAQRFSDQNKWSGTNWKGAEGVQPGANPPPTRNVRPATPASKNYTFGMLGVQPGQQPAQSAPGTMQGRGAPPVQTLQTPNTIDDIIAAAKTNPNMSGPARNPQEAIYGKQDFIPNSLWTKAQKFAGQTQLPGKPKFGETPLMFELRKAGVSDDLATLKEHERRVKKQFPNMKESQLLDIFKKSMVE